MIVRSGGGVLELLAAVVIAVVVLMVHGLEAPTLLLLYLAAVSPSLIIADITERRLPNRLVLPGYPVVAAVMLIFWASGASIPPTAVIAAVAYFMFLLALCALGGMGMGDVKLAGVLGFAAGSLGTDVALLSPVFAFAVGGSASVIALYRGIGSTVAFGPCMIAGFWAAALFF
jgi:leader peptidase (prepilin peptidase)/N-methyltransferase